MSQHNVLGNGEPQAGPSRLPRPGLIHAIKTLEKTRQVLRRDAGTEILHVKLHAAWDRPRSQHYPASCGSILERIFHQVREYLMDRLWVCSYLGIRVIFHLQLHIQRASKLAKTLHCLVQKLSRCNRLNRKLLFTGFHSRQSKQVLCETRHSGCILANDFQKFPRMIVPGRAIKQGFGVSLNGGEWRAQLVRNVSDKIPPGLFNALGFGEITQDRHRPAAGQWPRSHIERATWQNGGGAGGGGSSLGAGSPHSAEEIRVSHRLDYRSI